MECLAYRPEKVPKTIREASGEAARACGYDQFEEELLHSEILNVRWVAVDSVKTHFSAFLEPPCTFSPRKVVRIDWQTWAVKTQFDGQYEEAVVERVESIVVDVPTLMAGEVFSYGLGPRKQLARMARSPVDWQGAP